MRRRSFIYMRTLSSVLALLLVLGTAWVGETGAESSRAVEVDPKLAAMQERVEAVFDRLAAVVVPLHPEVAEYTIEAVIEKIPNAWINHNNEIYVTSGLLDLLKEDDQLGGVIAHELAHGTQGHIPHRINQSLWSTFAVIALGTLASTQGSSDWGGLLHMRDLFMFAFSREQESEADLVGVRYARAAGYRSEGLVEALKAMDDERQRLPEDSVWNQLYRTHPPIAQRVLELRLILATEQLDRAPLRVGDMGGGGLGPVAAGANDAETVARGFGRALLSGDEAGLRAYVLPGKTTEAFDWAYGPGGNIAGGGGGALSQYVHPTWSAAELDVALRAPAAFSTGLVVRLRRSVSAEEVLAGRQVGPEVVGPTLSLTLQQSARGWVVTAWKLVSDSDLPDQ